MTRSPDSLVPSGSGQPDPEKRDDKALNCWQGYTVTALPCLVKRSSTFASSAAGRNGFSRESADPGGSCLKSWSSALLQPSCGIPETNRIDASGCDFTSSSASFVPDTSGSVTSHSIRSMGPSKRPQAYIASCPVAASST